MDIPSRNKMSLLATVVLVILPVSAVAAQEGGARASHREVELEVRETLWLDKESGRVDQVQPVPGGGWAVRDYTHDPPQEQRVELYDGEGRKQGMIRSYGRGPEKYVRLSDMAVDVEDRLWVADLGSSRILRYALNGDFLSSVLLQNPSYRPSRIALDPKRGRFFVAGCYPMETYLDQGCLLVHQYRLDNGSFLGSFVETDPKAIEKRWAGRSDYDLTIGPEGQVYFIHEAVFELVRLDPDEGETRAFSVQSDVATPPPHLSRETVVSTEAKEEAMRSSFRLDRVVAAGDNVLVSIAAPNDESYLLAAFREGRQIAQDLQAPGRLVGRTEDEEWIFVRRDADGFALDFVSLEPGGGS